jgi:hypothetical protein
MASKDAHKQSDYYIFSTSHDYRTPSITHPCSLFQKTASITLFKPCLHLEKDAKRELRSPNGNYLLAKLICRLWDRTTTAQITHQQQQQQQQDGCSGACRS